MAIALRVPAKVITNWTAVDHLPYYAPISAWHYATGMMNGTQTTLTAAYTITQLVQAWNDHDLPRLVALYSTTFRGRDSAATDELHGRAAVAAHCRRYLLAFPDLTLMAQAIHVAGDHVTLIWHASGTHSGEFLHIPPTLRRATLSGITVFGLADGEIAHSTTVWDVAAWLRAVGLLPKL